MFHNVLCRHFSLISWKPDSNPDCGSIWNNCNGLTAPFLTHFADLSVAKNSSSGESFFCVQNIKIDFLLRSRLNPDPSSGRPDANYFVKKVKKIQEKENMKHFFFT
jgi:hypothetical protein